MCDHNPSISRRNPGLVFPSHLRPVILKPVGRIFEISDQTRYRENAENADVPPTPGKQGSEEIPQNETAENAENADTKTRKMRKMRMTGFNVTGFRLTPIIGDDNARRKLLFQSILTPIQGGLKWLEVASNLKSEPLTERAKAAEKASCGETVVQNGLSKNTLF